MLRRALRSSLALAASAVCVASAALMPSVAQAGSPEVGAATVSHRQDLPPTEILYFGVVPLKNAAVIKWSKWGYRYKAGQQDSHLTITFENNRLRYVDTGTRELRSIPDSCSRISVPRGIGASCRVPARYTSANPIFLEVWPRLGDDVVDGSTLSDRFRLWTLADAGFDVVYGGDGDDFVNGAQDNDKAWGGAGRDWLRTGIGNDQIWGDAGNDNLVSLDGHDRVHGGDGDDEVYGGTGDDELWGDAGADRLSCSSGNDTAWHDALDHLVECEHSQQG